MTHPASLRPEIAARLHQGVVIPAHPLDVQDAVIHYANKGAIIQSNFMV